MPRDRETPQTGLQQRRGEGKLGGELSGEVVPCRQCGEGVELTSIAVEVRDQMRRHAQQQGFEPLQPDELVVCKGKACRDAEREEKDRRLQRENNQTQGIIDAIKRGEAVSVPSEIIQFRPSCHARIRAALEARREGRLPTLDAEID